MEEFSTEESTVVGVGASRFVALVPLVIRWSLIDLSMLSHLAQKARAQHILLPEVGGGSEIRLHTHDTCPL